jgi:hypothetical protein
VAGFQRIADRIEEDQGKGAVAAMIRAALARMIGFEIQFGPFAVAQLRLTAEVLDLLNANTAEPEHIARRCATSDALGSPRAWLRRMLLWPTRRWERGPSCSVCSLDDFVAQQAAQTRAYLRKLWRGSWRNGIPANLTESQNLLCGIVLGSSH